MKLRAGIAFVLLTICARTADAQGGPAADSVSARPGVLVVRSASPGTEVYLDGAAVGMAPLESLAVSPGPHVLCCQPGPGGSWIVEPVCDSILVRGGERQEREVLFPKYVMLATEPSDARVAASDRDDSTQQPCGSTPLWIALQGKERAVRIDKDGYAPLLLTVRNDTMVALTRAAQGIAVDPAFRSSPSALPVYLTAGAAIIAGAAAAYFKIEADHRYRDYRETNDPALLGSIHRYDRASGIALAVCEINLAGLAYLLFRR